ncbi:MAG: DUF3237 family protein [Polyangiales bacterium]
MTTCISTITSARRLGLRAIFFVCVGCSSETPDATVAPVADSGSGGAAAVADSASRPIMAPTTRSTAGVGGFVTPTAGAGAAASSPATAGAAGAAGLPDHAGADAGAAPTVVIDERQTLVPDPGWSCGMPTGIPGPALGEHAFDIDLDLGDVRDLGNTPFGHRRRIDVRGGTIDGDGIRGRVKSWGIEDELALDNGVLELEELHMLQLGDEQVFLRGCGIAPTPDHPARMVLDIEAAKGGSYAALNEGLYVATRSYDEPLKLLRIAVYKLAPNTPADPRAGAQIIRPPGRPGQTPECKATAAKRGSELYRATIDLAGYWSVGESKHGTRNMIPITGGTLTGKLEGRILAGGADYQLSKDDTLTLDARYLIELADGELIAVRNCGQVGSLIPTFEARADGPYTWLNNSPFVSTDPSPKPDLTGIDLTVFAAE